MLASVEELGLNWLFHAQSSRISCGLPVLATKMLLSAGLHHPRYKLECQFGAELQYAASAGTGDLTEAGAVQGCARRGAA